MPSFRHVGALLAAIASRFFTATGTRVAAPAVEFKFDRTECLAGYASDSNRLELLGHLSINTSAVECKGLGVEAKPMSDGDRSIVSTSTSSQFTKGMKKGLGWTLEAWLVFSSFSGCPTCKFRHLASISLTKDQLDTECNLTSGMVLLQQNLGLTLVMQQKDDDNDECESSSTTLLAIEWGLPVHVVFTPGVDQEVDSTRWYVNGIQLGVGNIDGHLLGTPWNSAQDDLYLQLLSNAAATTDFASPAGSILLFAMYNRTLNESEVLQNFDAGLANTPPVADDITVVMNEDGATQDEYENPAVYMNDPMIPAVDLPVIVLSVTDMDQQFGFPGFDPSAEPALPIVFIDSLPSRGTLFDLMNGTAIIHAPHQVPCDGCDGDFSVRYRPEKDSFSGLNRTYTSFTYSAVDGVTGDQSVVAGLVEIYVLPKNDPPVPVNMSTTILAGEVCTLLLAGLDADSSEGDSIVGAFLHQSPVYGSLFQVSDSEIKPSAEVNDGDRISGQLVLYVFKGNPSQDVDPSSGKFLIQDSFTFRLFDSFDAISTRGTASLTIVSGMKAVTAQSRNDSSWICDEDVESQVNVYVEDVGASAGNVIVVISVVPKHGSLLLVSDNHVLEAGGTVSTSCTTFDLCMSSLRYLPPKDFFNSPTEKWNGNAVKDNPQAEQFSFYALVRETGEYSNVAVQDIQVVNSNDPVEVFCPDEVYEVQPFGSNVYSDGSWFPLDRIYISGISFVDPDEGVDVVKVKVSTTFGLLTLNPDYVDSLHFNSHAFCYEGNDLQCLGSGSSERELVFVADHTNAANALNGMSYQSVVSNVADSVVITVFDGANGKCLSDKLVSAGTCWQVSCTISVTVAGRDASFGRVSVADLSFRLLASISLTLTILACWIISMCVHCACCWTSGHPNSV